MALPRISLPLYEITIPSTDKKVTYRPFTVKEEKILLLAKESKDIDQIILAITQIINNCVKDVDVSKLSTFDLEYLMFNIRARSVNDIIKFKVSDPDTNEDVELELNINSVTMVKNDQHNKIIKLNDDYNLVMRYPTVNELKVLSDTDSNDTSKIFDMMIGCIDFIASGDSITKMSECTPKEVVDFVEGLPTSAIKDIQTFFQTMPVMRVECPYVNRKGEHKSFVIQGIESFFI